MLTDQINDVKDLQSASASKMCITEIAIGSTNPIKIQAVKNALENENIRVVPCSAVSNVRPQPLSDEETLQGAINRAADCLEKTNADLAIGLEGGAILFQNQVYLCHWGAFVDRNHNTYFTNGPLILLPAEFREALWEGEILEDIMHHYIGIKGLGSKGGAVGIFTQNYLSREQMMTQIVKVLISQYRYYQSEKAS